MKRSVWVLAVLVAAPACGGGENVVLRASLDEAGAQPVADLPVRLLPYDRQGILDSLARESDSPQPKLPADAMDRLRSLQAEEARVKPRGDSAVARVAAERRAYVAGLDSIRKAREKWLEARSEDFATAAKERNPHGLGELSDTTDAAGRASFAAHAGKWWAVSRYVLPDAVLEWAVPVRAKDKDSVVVHLTRQNARVEPFF
ncbi:MAG TPA: hypothetical protein VGO40_02945 [Longimicrobium sp.]|jgi:hypothetical protein|nr:hypothetical protein [Longimicrobium sp.]